MEEYIGMLITAMAYKKDHPNAAIAAIPLEKLGVKEFGKNKMVLDSQEDKKFFEEENQEEERDEFAFSKKDLF